MLIDEISEIGPCVDEIHFNYTATPVLLSAVQFCQPFGRDGRLRCGKKCSRPLFHFHSSQYMLANRESRRGPYSTILMQLLQNSFRKSTGGIRV